MGRNDELLHSVVRTQTRPPQQKGRGWKGSSMLTEFTPAKVIR
uniref:Uncharacterized protein n=1 Tax=Arundo donax TaxID=35708 RepID=A0A0A9G0K5_ARUDO